MTVEQVNDLLNNYRVNCGRVASIDCEIEWRELKIEELRSTVVEDNVNIGQNLSGMPHSGRISDPTGQLGSRLADGFITQDIIDMQREIIALKMEKSKRMISIRCVDGWLKALNDREKLVVMLHVIDKLYWRDVIKMYKDKFGDYYSKDGLRHLKKMTLEKIYDFAK